jgi:hypothetical protein
MARKNIEDYFGEKNRDKSKCKNILTTIKLKTY